MIETVGILPQRFPGFRLSGRAYSRTDGSRLGAGREKRQAGNMNKKSGGKKRKKRKYKGLHIVFGILSGIVLLIALVGLIFVLVYKAGQVKLMQAAEGKTPDMRLPGSEEEEMIAREKANLQTVQWEDNWVVVGDKIYSYDENCVNLLFLGVDSAGEMGEETDFENWESGQTDAIFLVSLNPTKKSISIIGIPRNSMVNIDIYDAENHKIDTVFDEICLQYTFAGGGKPGLERTKESVSELLYGLPVHGAFAIGYDAVGVINDMAGGVDVEVLETFEAGKQKYEKGKLLHLDGKLALAYVKWRDYGQLGSPTLRLQRQKQYLLALTGKLRGEVKENPMLVKDMYGAVTSYMNTDVTLEEAVYLATQSLDYKLGESSFYLLQGEDRMVEIPEEKLQGMAIKEPFYDDYYLDEDGIREIMLEVFYEEVVLGEE